MSDIVQITLGRATKDKQIDVDLSLEGPAWKISRKQGDPSSIHAAVIWPHNVPFSCEYTLGFLLDIIYQYNTALINVAPQPFAYIDHRCNPWLSVCVYILILTFSGIIKLKNNGDFFIANEGRRPIYIDGRPVLSGNKWKLNNNSVVEVGNGPLTVWNKHDIRYSIVLLSQGVFASVQIAGLRFVFLINLELISLIKAEAAKMTQQWTLQLKDGNTCWGSWLREKESVINNSLD